MAENVALIFGANFLLIAVAVILVFFAIIGYSKGFIKMVISFLSIFITLILVITLLPRISDVLKETEIYEKLRRETTAVICQRIQSEFDKDELFKGVSDVDQMTDQVLEKLHIPESFKGFVKENISTENFLEVTRENVANAFAEKIGEKVADLLLNCGIFIISYVIILMGIKFLFTVLNLISLLPIIHGANKIAGFALGLAEGICVVWIFFILITIFGGAELNETLFPQIQGNKLLLFLYENNLFMKFLLK